jgi:hypothetical protein
LGSEPATSHIEDDELLAGVVQSAFDAFGFLGQFLIALTRKEALATLSGDPEPTLPRFGVRVCGA